MVEDKQNKMRETLRLMSLEPFSYTISIFAVQMIFAVSAAIIIGLGLQLNKRVFPEDEPDRV